MKRENQKYTTIHIPTALAKFIDALIDEGEFAYTSRSEFVKDSIRRSLETHGYYPKVSKSLLEEAFASEKFEKILNKRIMQLKEFRELLLETEEKVRKTKDQ